jgi:hypothetical protein
VEQELLTLPWRMPLVEQELLTLPWRVPLVEQELLTLPVVHLPVCNGPTSDYKDYKDTHNFDIANSYLMNN